MAKTLDPSVLTAAQAAANFPTFLMAIASWGGGTVRYHSSGEDVTYSSDVYDGRRFSVGTIGYAADGVSPATTISLDDADLAVTKAHISDDVRGKSVNLWRLYRNLSTHTVIGVNVLLAGWTVGVIGYTDTLLTWELAAFRQAASRRTPGLSFDRTCFRVYASPDTGYNECQHADVCDHTYVACRDTYNYRQNFGGVPLLTRRRF